MKNTAKNLALLVILATGISCQKDQFHTSENKLENQTNLLSIDQAQTWLSQQNESLVKNKLPIRWSSAKIVTTKSGNRVVLPLPGQPSLQNINMGYRQLSIQRDPITREIMGRFVEVIPDYLYHQEK
ncbi:MAG: hypothetical protein EOO20_11470, partial [Chryseobacterium sp.]